MESLLLWSGIIIGILGFPFFLSWFHRLYKLNEYLSDAPRKWIFALDERAFNETQLEAITKVRALGMKIAAYIGVLIIIGWLHGYVKR